MYVMLDTYACKIIDNEESAIVYNRETKRGREREIFSPVTLIQSIIIWTSRRPGYVGFRSNLLVAHAGGCLPIMTDIPFDVEGDTIAHGEIAAHVEGLSSWKCGALDGIICAPREIE